MSTSTGRCSIAHVKILVLLLMLSELGLVIGCRDKKQDSSEPIRIVSWGGRFQQDLFKDWWTPAAESCGVKIEPDSWDGVYGALTARIQKGINDWDLVHVEAHYVQNADASSLFESFNRTIDSIDPGLVNQTAVPVLQYGYALAYRRDLLHRTNQPDWAEFFDVGRWPGRRSLRDFPVGNIEIALLAEHRDVNQVLYDPKLSRAQLESQVEDAFRRLETIRPSVIWWSSGDELQRGLTSGDIVMSAAWSGRILSAYRELCNTTAVEECKLQVNGNTALVSTDWWVIPKHAPHAERANKLLQCMYTAPQAIKGALLFSQHQGYLVPLKSVSLSDPAADYFLRIGSSQNPHMRAHIDERFWSQNYDWINNRWKQWRAAH